MQKNNIRGEKYEKNLLYLLCFGVALTSFVLMSSVSVRAANEFENAEIGYGELIDSFIETVNPDEVNYLEIINKTDYENFIEYLQDNQASYDLNANSMNYSADFNDEKHLNALLIDAMNAGYVTNYYGDISLFWAGGNNSSGTHYRLGDRIITILQYVNMVEMGLYLAQEYGTAIINRFMYDVSAASSFPKLQNNGIYCIRNYSGLYMDVDDMLTAEGTHLSTYFYHGQINQRFKVVFNTNEADLLTINIVPMLAPEKLVSAVDDFWAFDISINSPQSNSDVHQKYRITFMSLLNGGARINLNAECKKVISVRDRSAGQNRLNVGDFDPERTDQQWFFELFS